MPQPLKICFATSELKPFSKSGGLADVAAALPRQLHLLGHDVRVFTPLYAGIDTSSRGFFRVEFIQDVPVSLGSRSYNFSLYAAPLPGSELAPYFIDCPELYHRPQLYTDDPDEPQRFGLFSRAVIECCQRMGWAPDVFHCNDWHTALIPLWLRTTYDWDSMFHRSRTLLTVHNIGYQGSFASGAVDLLGLGPWTHLLDPQDRAAGRLNLLRTGLIYADLVSTVSPTYAREIQTDGYGMGLESLLRQRRGTLVGILNGIDYEEWSPERDRVIPYPFSSDRLEGKSDNKRYLLEQLGLSTDTTRPLAGVISRLVYQKGMDLCSEVLPEALAHGGMRLVVLGSGEQRYEELFARLEQRFPGQVCFYRGYSDELAHLIEAGSDMFLMPSRYEPCGLNQMFSMRYGTIPIVRRTGGLADSVQPFDSQDGSGTGFVFEHFTPEGLRWALSLALATYRDRSTWLRLMRNAMRQDFSWEVQSRRYVELYSWLAGR